MPRHIVCFSYDFETQSGYRGGETRQRPCRAANSEHGPSHRILPVPPRASVSAAPRSVPGFTIESYPRSAKPWSPAATRSAMLGTHSQCRHDAARKRRPILSAPMRRSFV